MDTLRGFKLNRCYDLRKIPDLRSSGFMKLDVIRHQAPQPLASQSSEPHFIGVHINGLRPFRVTPARSSTIIVSSGSPLRGNPHILCLPFKYLLLMFIAATFCLLIFRLHLGHSNSCPTLGLHPKPVSRAPLHQNNLIRTLISLYEI